eukprot:GEZU01017290.1.p1 GENE.GEZU01017290.1~~GEZU01017290.1.p1  ORF type:complete len:234 (+),score=58.44 GEZU01017290.1:360-1061(+)
MDLAVIRPVIPAFRIMPQAWVKSIKNETVDIIDLDPFLFSCTPRRDILHRMVVWQLAKKRQGTHRTLYKTEVAYTTKKIRRQKGLGMARAGSRSVPQFRGGGRAFPKRPRDYSFDIPKKVRRLALRMAITTKYQQGRVIVIDDTTIEQPKTRIVEKLLQGLGVTELGGVLIVDGNNKNEKFEQACFNLHYVDFLPAQGINVYDMLRREKLILTKSALEDLSAHFAKYKEMGEE